MCGSVWKNKRCASIHSFIITLVHDGTTRRTNVYNFLVVFNYICKMVLKETSLVSSLPHTYIHTTLIIISFPFYSFITINQYYLFSRLCYQACAFRTQTRTYRNRGMAIVVRKSIFVVYERDGRALALQVLKPQLFSGILRVSHQNIYAMCTHIHEKNEQLTMRGNIIIISILLRTMFIRSLLLWYVSAWFLGFCFLLPSVFVLWENFHGFMRDFWLPHLYI